MAFSDTAMIAALTPDGRLLFEARYGRLEKSRSTAFLLTLLLGGVGAHRFYLGQVALGFLYLTFCWTFVPAIVALIELFFIGGRVDHYNQRLATETAAEVRLLSGVRRSSSG